MSGVCKSNASTQGLASQTCMSYLSVALEQKCQSENVGLLGHFNAASAFTSPYLGCIETAPHESDASRPRMPSLLHSITYCMYADHDMFIFYLVYPFPQSQ